MIEDKNVWFVVQWKLVRCRWKIKLIDVKLEDDKGTQHTMQMIDYVSQMIVLDKYHRWQSRFYNRFKYLPTTQTTKEMTQTPKLSFNVE